VTTRVLFTGYAPVHFLCFQPVFERLRREKSVEVFVSGGLRTKNAALEWEYDETAMYAPFDMPAGSVLSVNQIRDIDFDVIFAANTQLIMPRSVDTRVQIFHGVSFRNKAVREENTHCDHYFIVGPYMHRRFVDAGLFEADDPRAMKIGFAKTDRLVNGSLDRAALLRAHGLSGERPVILYAPTGQRRNSMEVMGAEVVKKIAATNKFDLLIKLHDHAKDRTFDPYAELLPLQNEHTKVVDDLDVIPLLFLADLLVSDASSVSSEYSLLDRPMIFLDCPELFAALRAEPGCQMDLDTWGRNGGIVVEKPDGIVAAIEQSFSDPSAKSDVRRAMAKDIFYNPGHATEAAAKWLVDAFSLTK
jgi:hypothetical protein